MAREENGSGVGELQEVSYLGLQRSRLEDCEVEEDSRGVGPLYTDFTGLGRAVRFWLFALFQGAVEEGDVVFFEVCL